LGKTNRAGPGTTIVNVLGTGVPTNLFNNGAATINVGSGNRINGITGALILENEPSFDTVNINDQNDPVYQSAKLSTVSGKPYNFTGGQLSGLVGVAPITWDYSDTAQVTLNTGSAGATVTALGAGVPTFINGSAAATNSVVGGNLLTTWHVNSANAGTLSNAAANVTFTAFQNLTSGYGSDGFYFGNGATLSGLLNGGGGSGLSLAAYTTNLTVNITGGGAGNLPGVVGAFQGVQYLATGSGNDSFVFSNTGSITSISSVGGTNTLDASAVSRNLSVSVYGANAGTVPGMVFEFADIENIKGGSGNNTFVFSSGASLAGTLNGGSGNNLIDTSPYTTGQTFSVTGANSGSAAGLVGAFNHVQNLIGASGGGNVFAFSGGGSLAGEVDGGVGGHNLLDYSTYPTGVTVDLSTDSATGVGGSVVNIQELRGSGGNDHLTGNGAGSTTFFASPGTDTITGLGSGNTLVGTNANSTWKITGSNAGTLTWGANTSTFTGVQNLTGGTGADDFIFSKGMGVSGAIHGGGGNDSLDYSAYTTTVIVDLQTGFATGVTGGVARIKNVTGGNGSGGYNILVGNGGNILTGGNGRRNLLIAGASASQLTGGNGEDILIAGTTDYDTNLTALKSIMGVWNGPGLYNARVAKVTNPGATYHLTTATVHSNGGGNKLKGKPSGSALDLYFANLGKGDMTDATVADTFITIS
jgi:hypothetical protein